MERVTTLKDAEKIMGRNLIGPKELNRIGMRFKIAIPEDDIPAILFSKTYLEKIKNDYILVLGLSKDKNGNALTINRMRDIFGVDPKKAEPCFYNQDWYSKEKFCAKKTLSFQWYLIAKKVKEKTRGKKPDIIEEIIKNREFFPSAILVVFTFFTYYLCRQKEILWKNDFIWCIDKDSNSDRVYVGRYSDPQKINKNGFNIHRHLSIRHCYGLSPEIK